MRLYGLIQDWPEYSSNGLTICPLLRDFPSYESGRAIVKTWASGCAVCFRMPLQRNTIVMRLCILFHNRSPLLSTIIIPIASHRDFLSSGYCYIYLGVADVGSKPGWHLAEKWSWDQREKERERERKNLLAFFFVKANVVECFFSFSIITLAAFNVVSKLNRKTLHSVSCHDSGKQVVQF